MGTSEVDVTGSLRLHIPFLSERVLGVTLRVPSGCHIGGRAAGLTLENTTTGRLPPRATTVEGAKFLAPLGS